jgi:L-ascorbate metabolism protein UlaG (beta-lactamase superfamily)
MVSNGAFLSGCPIPGPKALHGFPDVHLPKDHVLTTQPLHLGRADEKLGATCVGFHIGHRQDAGTCVLQDQALIIKLLPIDVLLLPVSGWHGRSPPWHMNPVKARTLGTKSFHSSAQSTGTWSVNSPKETWPRPCHRW